MPDLPIEPPLPTADEKRVAEKILGVCMHWHWKRSIEEYAQYASCVACGKRLYLGGNCEPDLSPAAVAALWLRLLPRPATDEAAAGEVVRKLEEKGWSIKLIQTGSSVGCVLEKEHFRFESSAHETRAAAITEAAAKAAAGNFSAGSG